MINPELDNKPYGNTYADYILKYQNFRITRTNQGKEEELFTRKRTIYNQHWKERDFYMTPEVTVGIFKKSRYQKEITDVRALASLGYGIYRHRPAGMGGFRRKMQMIVYSIRKLGTIISNPSSTGGGLYIRGAPLMNAATTIPRDHKVIWDQTYQTLRITGPNSDGRVVYMKGRPKNLANRKEESYVEMIARMNDESYDEGEEIKIKIDELMVGMCLERNLLVCVPKTHDPWRFGWCGTTGCGKTLWMHGVIDQLVHVQKALVTYLNDYKYETDTWSKETKTHEFKIMLKNFGLGPMPLPIVYLNPQIKEYSPEKEDMLEPHEQRIAYCISLPWQEILGRFNQLFSDFSEMRFEKSLRWVPWELLKEAKDTAEAINMLGQKVKNEDARRRVINTFTFLFEKKMMDIDSGLGSSWKVQKQVEDKTISEEELHPLIAALKCNLVPVFVTKDLQTVMFGRTDFTTSYIKYLTTLILETKKNTKILKDDLIIPFIDELQQIIRSGAIQPIVELSALGRSANLGFGWGSQNYKEIPQTIRVNTHYLFAMKTNSEEINAICKDYNAPKHIKDDMATLGSKRPIEGYLFHTNPIITYDLENGEREEIKDEPIKLIPIPIMSEHRRPGFTNE